MLTTLLLTGLLPARGSDAAEPDHDPVNLSFIYPISTNQTPDVSTSLRFSLFYGRLHSIRGLDLNAGVSWLHGDMRGLQLNGLYSQIDGEMRGAAFSFGPQFVRGDMRGLQWTAFPNLVGGDMHGFQYSTMLNLVQGELSGVQAAPLVNITDGGGGFLQIGGVANASASEFRGLQLAAGLNYGRYDVTVGQVGLANLVYNTGGLQIGFLNMAENNHGLQMGVLNLNQRMEGVPIGLFNYSEENGDEAAVAYASTYSLFNVGIRTVVNSVTSIFAVGVNDVDNDQPDTVFLSWHPGYRMPLGTNLSFIPEFGYVHVIPQPSDDPEVNDRLRFSLQARVSVEYRLSPGFSVFGGGGVENRFSSYDDTASSVTHGLGFAGITVF